MSTQPDRVSELERIRLYTLSARQRIRRVDVLLDEQIRILKLDPSLRSAAFQRRNAVRAFSVIEIRLFIAAFTVAALTAFYTGFWLSHH